MPTTPTSLTHLQELVDQELRTCSAAQRQFFIHASLDPTKWSLFPWGNDTGGFWVLATFEGRVLWYNDIENGFNVSQFVERGVIPTDEYRSDRDPLPPALLKLVGDYGFGFLSRGPKSVSSSRGEEQQTFRREIGKILSRTPQELDLDSDLQRDCGLDELDVYECIQVAEDIWNVSLVPNPCPRYLFSEVVGRYTTLASILEAARRGSA